MKQTVDCHDENSRFMAWLQNQYTQSDYVFSMDFAEYYSRYGAYMAERWGKEHGIK